MVALLPPQAEGMAEVVSRLDGLIITGGADGGSGALRPDASSDDQGAP